VAGYSTTLPFKLRFKAEAYYQKLYHIGVEKDSSSGFSLLNAEGAYSLVETEKPMVSTGTGQNYGIDLSLERPFNKGWYLLATGSVYKSTYKDYAGHEYNTSTIAVHRLISLVAKNIRSMQQVQKFWG